MNCPDCNSPHHIALAPIYNSTHLPASVASVAGIFGKKVFLPARVERTEVGAWVKCFSCGSEYGNTPNGVIKPKWKQQARQPSPVPNGNPQRPAPIFEDDLRPAPDFS